MDNINEHGGPSVLSVKTACTVSTLGVVGVILEKIGKLQLVPTVSTGKF